MNKRRTAAIAGAILVVVAGLIITQWRSANRSGDDRPVRTARVEKGTVAPKLAVTGYLASVAERQVYSTVSGPVLEIIASVGDTVTAGDPLVRLETGTPGQTVNIAYADLVEARAVLDEIHAAEASADEISAQETEVETAESNYSAAVANRYSDTVDSPITGTVIAVNASIGDQVSAGSGGAASAGTGATGLVTVADLNRFQVKTEIDQADISKVEVGQNVTVKLDALPGEEFQGRVAKIDPVAQTNQNVVTYVTYISLSEREAGMRLGMSADLELDLEEAEDALYVSNVAIHSRNDRKYVTKLIDGEPVEVRVEVGLVAADRTEIVSGLSAGDEISLQSFNAAGSGQRSFGGGFGGGFGRGIGGGGRPPGR